MAEIAKTHSVSKNNFHALMNNTAYSVYIHYQNDKINLGCQELLGNGYVHLHFSVISAKYNMSDCIVSDIQCRAAGETF